MNWRDIDWDIPTLGRLAGIGIVVTGIVLAMLDASALNLHFVGSHARVRYFLHEVTSFAWQGGLVFAVAEIADRLVWGGRSRFDWRGVQVLRWLGIGVIVVRIGVTTWDFLLLPDIVWSNVARAYSHEIINALWSGGILLLAAAIADRLRVWEQDAGDIVEAPA